MEALCLISEPASAVVSVSVSCVFLTWQGPFLARLKASNFFSLAGVGRNLSRFICCGLLAAKDMAINPLLQQGLENEPVDGPSLLCST